MNLSAYVGVPFVERGRDRDGADCYGLLRIVYEDVFRIILPSYSEDYVTTQDREAISALIDGGKDCWRPVDAPEPGDVVLLALAGRPCHLGIAASGDMVLHTDRKSGAVIEPLNSPRLRRRVLGFLRHESR